jgi:hypothetical protein
MKLNLADNGPHAELSLIKSKTGIPINQTEEHNFCMVTS